MDVRPARETDMAFVRETACKARWPRLCTNPWDPPASRVYTRPFSWREWEASHGPTVDTWIADGQCLVLDAGQDTILGFVIVAEDLVRMLYVKQEFRGNGFGAELLRALGIDPLTARPHLPTPSWDMWLARLRRNPMVAA